MARPEGEAGTARLTPLLRLSLLAGPMLSMIDSSVVNVAIPDIVTGLHTSLGTAAWVVSGYLLGLACGLAATPWLTRRLGTLPAYSAVLLGFVLASAACGLVPDVSLLIAARVIQGLVGAPLVPLALTLILGPDPDTRNMPASAGVVLFAAPALGPAIGGLLISEFGWRSVFFVNVPVGLAALAGLRAARAAVRGEPGDPRARLDLPGLVLLAGGLGLATYGASRGPAAGWLSADSLCATAGGLALIAGYAAWERSRRGRAGPAPPAVNLGLLRSARRSGILALTCVASVVLFAMLFLAPVFLEDIGHSSATVTGLVLLPQGVAMGLASWLGQIVLDRGRTRPALVAWSVVGGLGLLALATFGLVLLTPTSPLWLITLLLCGRGAALGLTIQPLVMALLGGLDGGVLPDANTLFSIAERLSGSFGIALLATFYANRAALTGSPVAAFHDCAVVLAVVSAAGAVAATRPGPRSWFVSR